VTRVRLLGFGDYRPPATLTNADLERELDTSDEWIRRRTGIASRHVASPDESVVSMAAGATAKALAASGRTPDEVDLVLLATCSMTRPVPGGAPAVAAAIGAGAPGAVDLNAGCAGFSYALSWAADAIRAGSARTVAVVASERVTTWIDPADRSTRVLFGDGAGAAIVGAAPDSRAADDVGPVVWGSEGAQADALRVPDDSRWLEMDGAAVFRWAVSLAPVAEHACTAAGLAVSDLAMFVPHQANMRITDALTRALGIDPSKVCRDVVDTGNTSAASVPMALTRLVDSGTVPSGAPVLLLAFGAGLTYAAQVVRLP
jgi:3-oxoacyl-[acyl-carrier-protein] synthase-3